MKAVVTGASGFLGRAVASCLRASGAQVTAVSRRDLPGTLKVSSYADAPSGDVLFHLAQSSDRAAVNAAAPGVELEAGATVQALVRKGYERIVYASSAALYGDRDFEPRKPSDDVHVTDAYGRIKHRSESEVLATGDGLVVRMSNLYGPGMSRTNVLSTILAQLYDPGPLKLRDERPVRDFLWFADAAAGLVAMGAGGATGVYNLGSGRGTAVGELARRVLELTGQSERAVIPIEPAGPGSWLVLDISGTTARFQWTPRTTLDEGLIMILQYGARTTP